MTTYVVKRDGSREELDIEKLHRVMFWATDGLKNVSPSELELKSQIQFYDKMMTRDIHETMIRAASELISEESPNYQYVAGRLVNYQLRKEVYNGYRPIRLYDLIVKNVKNGFYDAGLLNLYTELEWDKIEKFVDHERDMQLTYVAMEQFRGKYLIKNRVTGKIFETPQVCYIIISAILFAEYPINSRLEHVKNYYEVISRGDISLPTPIMAGLRSPQKQFSSCTLIECDDSLESISATSAAIVKYVSQKAGIGIGAGRIRAVNSPVRNGDTSHTGVTPFYKLFQASVKSCSQGSVRNGSASLYYPIWHLEIEDMLVLKNNKGIEENRVRQMDYGVQFNKLFYERLVSGGNITLFSPHEHKEMYDAFFSDQPRFKELYELAEVNPNVRKKTISAKDLFSAFASERKDTGRIYLMNVDNANLHSSFDEKIAPVRMSNLCTEITLPTVPMATFRTNEITVAATRLVSLLALETSKKNVITNVKPLLDGSATVTVVEDLSRVQLCTLSATSMTNIKDEADMERVCRYTVRGLDSLLDYQSYPLEAAYKSTMEYRPLGVGIINLAYWLAKNDFKYSDGSGLAALDEFAEMWSYYLIKASVDLAEEKGPCILWKNTKYAQGLFPHETRKKEVDELVEYKLRMPWDTLREKMLRVGIRNSTLMAIMPAETSAQILNATNGIEPPRAFISVKQSKDGVLKQVVPEFRRLRNKYELLWDQKSPEGYLKICAVLQKWMDQSISTNTSYNPKFYPDEKVPMSEMLKHILLAYKWGIKTLYYCNTNAGGGEIDVSKFDDKAVEDEPCDSCTI
jgi:ribonucleoside-diphosphate reductase alpha chain